MRTKYLYILFLFLLASCSSTKPIEIYQVILPRTEVSKVVDIPVTLTNIRIEPFTDIRTSRAVATVDGQQVPAKTDLSEAVTSSVTKTLETAGFRSTSSGDVILVGEIRKFFSTFEGNMPSDGQAEVVLSMVVKDSQNRRTYTANYQGSAKTQTFFASESDVSNALEAALESALRQMIKDRQLLSFLRLKPTNTGSGNGSASYNTDLYW